MKKSTVAAKEMAKRSVQARREKWGEEGFKRRMREWGKLGGRPPKEQKQERSKKRAKGNKR